MQAFFSVLLIYLSIPETGLFHFNYCSFETISISGQSKSLSVYSFKIFLTILTHVLKIDEGSYNLIVLFCPEHTTFIHFMFTDRLSCLLHFNLCIVFVCFHRGGVVSAWLVLCSDFIKLKSWCHWGWFSFGGSEDESSSKIIYSVDKIRRMWL